MSTYKNGKKYWVDFRSSGIRYRKPSPDNTLKGARAYEVLLRSKLANGESLNNSKEKIYFKDFSQTWIEKYARVENKPSEVKNKISAINFHLVPFFGNTPLNRINDENITEFKNKKKESGLSNKSINNLLVILSKCLSTAVDWKYLKEMPRIKHLKTQRPGFDYLTEDELQKLLDNSSGQTKEMILMAAKTGLRFGELIGLEWKNVDLGNAPKIIVNQSIVRNLTGSTKGYKVRYIPLIKELYEMLISKEKTSNFVFARNNRHMIQSTCINELQTACKKAQIRKIGWHVLRHSFASHLAMRGITMVALQQLLGHSSMATTMIYAHLSPSSLANSIRLLEPQAEDSPTHNIPIESIAAAS